MKKLLLLIMFFTLFGCKANVIEAGNFEEKRIRLHEKHNGYDLCDTKPERCVNGVPW